MTRPLQPCGTNAAYQRHLKYKQVACNRCLKAHAEYMAAWKAGTLPVPPPVKCGTETGYRRHRQRREPSCEACRAYRRRYMRAWRKARKERVLAANRLTTLNDRSTP